MDGLMGDGWAYRLGGWMDRCMGGWVGRWMGEWLNRWVGGG